MNNNPKDDNWNIDREPTPGEQIFGVIASGLLCLLFGAAFAVALMSYLASPSVSSPLPVVILAAILFLCVFLFYRITATERQKPSSRTGIFVSYFLIVEGIVCLILFVGTSSIHLASVGLIGLAGGMTNLARIKRKKK